MKPSAVAIVPCEDLDRSQAFYEQLGFRLTSDYPLQGYRILHDRNEASVHLTRVEPGWLEPDRNAHGIYLYADNVDALAEGFAQSPETKPWGLREFAVTDPSGLLVRVGWPA